MMSTTLIAALEYRRQDLFAEGSAERMHRQALADPQARESAPAPRVSPVRKLAHRVATLLATRPALSAVRLRSRAV